MSRTIERNKACKRIVPNWDEIDKYLDVTGMNERDFAVAIGISWTLYWNLRRYGGMNLPVPNKMMISVMELTGWPFERCFLITKD
ncbi:MAG TPA: hypothetical protein VGK02_06150 [Candidatus Aquicultor sp.]|jgi:hypothetical protein